MFINKLIHLIILYSISQNFLLSQNIKHVFFDYKQDSIKSRLTQISMPSNGQTAGICNSLVSDYAGNTRISISTSIIASKNDTFLAIHSLFNGIGNFTFEFESPLYCIPLTLNKINFVGLSINPRLSTLVNSGNMFQKSSINFDCGINSSLKIQGELGNLSAKLIFRNALVWGNNQFLEKIYSVNSKAFFYSSFQIRFKANSNIFNINTPLVVIPLNSKEISGFPIYAGLGFNF